MRSNPTRVYGWWLFKYIKTEIMILGAKQFLMPFRWKKDKLFCFKKIKYEEARNRQWKAGRGFWQDRNISIFWLSADRAVRNNKSDSRVAEFQNVETIFWGPATPCAFPPPRPSIFSDYSFWSNALLTGMTGISLHMRWPLTSQLHGSVSQREQLVFRYGSNPMPNVETITDNVFGVPDRPNYLAQVLRV
jgi:hypothetical protein